MRVWIAWHPAMILAAWGGLATTISGSEQAVAMFYVSTVGNDAFSGKLAEPHAGKTDGPLATLTGARNAIRALKKAGPLPSGGVTVVIRGGTYYLDSTFELTKEDSGTADAPIVYRAASAERVRILGGRPITGFTTHRGKVLKADVGSQGFKGIGFRQLLFDGRRQILARWPNLDPQNPYGGGWIYVDGKPVKHEDVANQSKNSILCRPGDLHTWSRPEEGEVFVFPGYNYGNNILPIKSVDAASRTIHLDADASYGIAPGDRYYIQGLIEELDAPGEWYLDRRTETLYFWPPEPMKGQTVCAPTLDTLIALGPETAYVTIRGLDLACCNKTAVLLTKTNNCLVAGNTIHHVGSYQGSGVAINGGNHNGAAGNDIFEIGNAGISLSGGDRKTLTAADNYAENNYIHHPGVFAKGAAGIRITGVGLRASHNLIHDCPRIGIMLGPGCNNVTVEYNHIRHVNVETEDSGAIYVFGRDWLNARGTRIAYNYCHDSIGYGRQGTRWMSPYYTWCIYLDDNTCGVDVIGNILARAYLAGIHLHNARDNRLENNIIIDCQKHQVQYSGWFEEHRFWRNNQPKMIAAYESMMENPEWRKYRGMDLHPGKAVLPDKLIMANNHLERNIFYWTVPEARALTYRDAPLDLNPSDYNLAWHPGGPITVGCGSRMTLAKPIPDKKDQDAPTDRWPAWWQAQGQDRHSIVADPKFFDIKKDDYRLKPNSPAFKLGFKPIPVEKIGPYQDELRASWPIVEAPGVREHPAKAPDLTNTK